MPLGDICTGCGDLTTEPVGGRCPRCAPVHLARTKARPLHRLRRWVYNHRRWPATRLAVFRRDNWTCQNPECGVRRRSGRGLVCDHIESIAVIWAAGRDPFDPGECQTLCLSCSGSKDAPRAAATARSPARG